ncbi:MAG TPA: dihydrodipicolinate synthase family protein, partial [Candidatus Hydrogenedentes bacterium]|nr:dihydrodipicolinate synthase family protein [Candidatus Hydrogenedentota bacterium]
VYEAVQAGDLDKAREAQWRANQVVQVLFRFKAGGVAVERAILQLMGFDVGAPRPPKVPFPDDRLPALRNALEEIGFLQ